MIARYVPTPKPEPRKVKGAGKPLVRVTYIPDQTAYLMVEGPEQSEIRWTHNGNTVIICNEFLERL
jgi:hypothetical protein